MPHGVGEPHGFDVVSVSRVSSGMTPRARRRRSVGISSGGTSSDCAAIAASCSSRRASPSLSAACALGPFTVHVENAWWVTIGAPALLREPARATEVVGVRVRDDHGVHVAQAEAGVGEALLQRLPRLRSGQTRVDDRDALGVDEPVHVHVAETRHPDRELHPQHARRDLGDLLRRRILLRLVRPRARPASASRPRRSPFEPTWCVLGGIRFGCAVVDAPDGRAVPLTSGVMRCART